MKMRLIVLCLFFVSVCGNWNTPKHIYGRMKTKENLRNFDRELSQARGLKAWAEQRNITNGTCFIHVPRTGGTSFKESMEEINVLLDSWHSGRKDVPTRCGCITNVRNPVERYFSEWNYYGLNWFVEGRRLFDWFPANGVPKTFWDYAKDKSTHNAMTKVLSGCQMFSECEVTYGDVDKIIERVANGCLRVFRTEDMPVRGHRAIFDRYSKDWRFDAHVANQVDLELYERLINLQ